MLICDNDKCFGCALCSDVCPVNAITITDENGFYRPQVDSNKCISCGLCKKSCISNSNISLLKMDDSIPCYAVSSQNEAVHFESSSGGFCTESSIQMIEDGGYVVGAWWNSENQAVEHRVCKTIAEVDLLKKSKYVQSKTEGIYKNVAEIIKSRKCLFIGVPCQVYALKKYVKNDNNLFCIDLICHGGASSKCLREHLSSINSDNTSLITFRGGEDDCTLAVYNRKRKKIYRGPQFTDPYFNYFMEHVLYQEQCFDCPFAGKQRVGDLTAGDFWGLAEDVLPKKGGKGINVVLINSAKGHVLFSKVKEKMICIPRKASEAISGNGTLQCATTMPSTYYKLWEQINRVGFKKALDLYSVDDYNKRVFAAKIKYKKYRLKKVIKRFIN